MRPHALAAILLALLLGCARQDYLVEDSRDPPRPPDPAALRYTAHASYISSIEVIPLRIDPSFTPADRAQIVWAIGQWNHALNGYVRFAPTIGFIAAPVVTSGTVATSWPTRTWSILPAHGAAPVTNGRRVLGITVPIHTGGGLIVVYVDRANRRGLTAVMLHELGHALGLDHDPAGRLMSVHYAPDNHQCIDKSAIAAVAAGRDLPLAELNWCEDAGSIAEIRAD